MEGLQPMFVGIDVGKKSIDFHLRPSGVHGSVARTAEGLAELMQTLAGLDVQQVVLEPTAGYERLVLVVLMEAELPVKLVPPDRARNFARSLGRRAKTDALDAALLAHMAEVAVDDIPDWRPPSAIAAELRALVQRRAGIVRMIEAENKRLKLIEIPSVVRSLNRLVKHLKAEKERLETALEKLYVRDEELARRVANLSGVQGVGLLTAITMLTEVPELGTLTRNEANALVGVAPYNSDSGNKTGTRYIQGGRKRARSALYMATFAGLTHNPIIMARYKHLRGRGKPAKVALVACMSKLLNHLNARLRAAAMASPTPTG